jgi:heat-inducible transcriptional repressor
MKPDISLTEREEAILQAVVDLYVKTAEPVGSRAIAQRYKLGLSPATIRNTMQDLEECGVLVQPHTSAGRVPTDLGYRYFVDKLLRPEALTEVESTEIRRQVEHDPVALHEILSQTSRVLSRLTNQLGVSVAPAFEKGVLHRIDLVQVTSTRVLVIIAVRSGLARTLLLEVDTEIPAARLDETRRQLNERLAGLTLAEVQRTAAERLRDTQGEPRLVKMFIESSERLITLQESDDLHLDGASKIMTQPEFRDTTNLSGLLQVIEDRAHLLERLKANEAGDGIIITIGEEFNDLDLANCAVVTSTYKVGSVTGTIGVLGPKRMPYSKLVSIVDYTSRVLTKVFSS